MALVLSKQDTLRKPPLGTQINTGHPLSQGLVGAWLMNEGGGATAYDVSGGLHKGTFNSVTWTTGDFGAGTNYNGSAYIDTGNWSNSLKNITVAAWIKPTSGTRQDIVSKWASGSYQYDLLQGVTASKFQFYISTDGSIAVGSAASTTSIVAGKWYFVVGTYDGANIKLFINGLQEGSSTSHSGNLNGSSTQNNLIGKSNDAIFTGALDNVLIYNRALSASEILQLYAQPFAFMQQPRIILPETPPLVNTGARFWFGITF